MSQIRPPDVTATAAVAAQPPAPKSVLSHINDWKELIVFIPAAVTSITGAILTQAPSDAGSPPNYLGWAIALVVTVGGIIWVRRRWKNQQKEAARLKLLLERSSPHARSAFRGLSPFGERDRLPGHDRRQQARAVVTAITSADFRFGVVCGDSGSGKTSLVASEMIQIIQASGNKVFYLRSPRQLMQGSASKKASAARIHDDLTILSDLIPPETPILVVDQFEEWFLEYPELKSRRILANWLRKLVDGSPPLKVICVVRQEFLSDFHDFADELPDPTSPRNTFRVRNFTIQQAMQIIVEGAHVDRQAPDDSFAATIAQDLSEGGVIRPPELQIVCTYLVEKGYFQIDKYRSEGGTAGILSHYIKDAITLSRSPSVTAVVLRALCDLPASAKRKPLSIDEIIEDVGAVAGVSSRKSRALVEEVLNHLVTARLLVVVQMEVPAKSKATVTYSLIHDYLVDAVRLATSDSSTQTEEANQLLRYYIAQGHSTIPLQKLKFIRTHADRRKLNERNARILIRRSRLVPIIYSTGTVGVAGVLAAVLFVISTAGIRWESRVVGRHWEQVHPVSTMIWSSKLKQDC